MKSSGFIASRTAFTGLVFVAATLLAVTSGCGGNQDTAQDTTPTQPAAGQAPAAAAPGAGAQDRAAPRRGRGMMQGMQSCPMMVQGVNVEASETEGGMAMTFTTTTGDVEDLRQRVRGMAQMHNQRSGQGMIGWHRMGEPGRGGMHHGRGMGRGMGPMPATTAAVENVKGGARLVLTPRDPAQLDALRAHVRMHTERMRTGECPMWQQQATTPGE